MVAFISRPLILTIVCAYVCVRMRAFANAFLSDPDGLETAAIQYTNLSSFISCLYESKVFCWSINQNITRRNK